MDNNEALEAYYGDEEELPRQVTVTVFPASPPTVTEEDRWIAHIRELFEVAGNRKPCLLCAQRIGYHGHGCPSFPKKALKSHLDSIVHKDVRQEAKHRCTTCFNLFFTENDLASHLKMLDGHSH
jgi:hypothetical protein